MREKEEILVSLFKGPTLCYNINVKKGLHSYESHMLRRIEMVVLADQKIHTAAKSKSKTNE